MSGKPFLVNQSQTRILSIIIILGAQTSFIFLLSIDFKARTTYNYKCEPKRIDVESDCFVVMDSVLSSKLNKILFDFNTYLLKML